jgi:hypothetical protein
LRWEEKKKGVEERKGGAAEEEGAGKKHGHVFLKQKKDSVMEIMNLSFAQIGQCMVTLWHRPTEQ